MTKGSVVGFSDTGRSRIEADLSFRGVSKSPSAVPRDGSLYSIEAEISLLPELRSGETLGQKKEIIASNILL